MADLTRALDTIFRGDAPGHPFRGNQYTDGQGGGGDLEARRDATGELEIVGKPKKMTLDFSMPGLRELLAREAKNLGLDPKKVKVTALPPKKIKDDETGNRMSVIATTETKTEQITFYEIPLWMSGQSVEQQRGTLRHEFMHVVTNRAWKVLKKEETEFDAAEREDHSLMVANNTFSAEAHERWPHFTAFVEEGFAGSEGAGMKAMLRQGKGVSEYADNWIAVAKKDPASCSTACHEIIAEIARREANGESLDALLKRRPAVARYRQLIWGAANTYQPKPKKRRA